MRICLLVLWMGLLTPSICFAQYPGTLDSTFWVNGVVGEAWFGSTNAQQLAVGPNDSIYLCGYSTQNNVNHPYVARFSPDGVLDPLFGVNGFAAIDVDSLGGRVFDVAALPDGKVLVTGDILKNISPSSTDLVLAKLMSDGSPDPSFGVGGQVRVAIDTISWESGQDLHVLSNGKILVTGFFIIDYQSKMLLMQFMPDGSLDSSFGQGGILVHGSPFRSEEAFGSAIQPDGKIVLGGRHQLFPSGPVGVIVSRFEADGSVDTTFGAYGEFVLADNNRNDLCEAVAVQPDGKIVVGGYYSDNAPTIGPLLLRLEADGSLDSTFGTAGISLSTLANERLFTRDLLLQGDGSILMVGGASFNNPIDNALAIAKFDDSGQLAMGFGTNQFGVDGVGLGPVEPYGEVLYGAAFQSDGRVVAAGYHVGDELLLVRFHTELSLFAVSEEEMWERGTVYPNPVSSGSRIHVPVHQSSKGIFCLYDVNGKRAWEWALERKITAREKSLELALPMGLRPGMYLLRQEGEVKENGFRVLVH